VIDGVGSVEEDRLLDHPLPDDLGEEVDVLLRATHARRQMVEPADQVQLVVAQLPFGCQFLSPSEGVLGYGFALPHGHRSLLS
jgi:hypothetical protein